MVEALIGLAGVLVGIAFTTVSELLRARLAFQRDKGWALWEEKRRRIEETYEAVEAHRAAYKDLLTRTFVAGKSTEALDGPLTKVPWPRLRMLVHLYVPELLGELAAIEKFGDAFGAEAARAMARQRPDGVAPPPQVVLEGFAALNRAYDDFVVKLVGIGGELSRAAFETTRGQLGSGGKVSRS